MTQYPAASVTLTSNRLITKSGSAGQTLLSLTSVVTDGTDLGYGSWAQIISSTASEYLVTGVYLLTADSVITPPWYVDIGTGGAGSEVVKASLISHIKSSTSTNANELQPLGILMRIPASTRIAARVAATTVGGAGRTIKVGLYVVPYTNVEGN